MTWAPTTNTRGVEEISISWVKSNHPSDKFLLVDCREQHEWDAGHIEGATFIPLSNFHALSQNLSNDKAVVVYCRSGMRSMSATKILAERGIPAASMTGGIMGWQG